MWKFKFAFPPLKSLIVILIIYPIFILQVSVAQVKSKATGIPLHLLLPNPSASDAAIGHDSSFVTCPNCRRSYSEAAGARHIPKVSQQLKHL